MSLFYQEAAVQKPVVFTGLKPGQEAVKVAKRGPLLSIWPLLRSH